MASVTDAQSAGGHSSPERRSMAGDAGARVEGFDHVVISAGFRTHQGVQLLGAGRQHENVGVGKQA